MVSRLDPELARQRALSESLQELAHHPLWDRYLDCLKDYEERQIERLIHSDPNEHNLICGIIQGLRLAAHLPERLAHELAA